MDNALKNLCNAIKKTLSDLKPEQNPVSFILLTGKTSQGKTVLLTQSHLNQVSLDFENKANIFYNKHGIIVELGEAWLTQNEHLLAYSLKKINQCHPHVRINGLFLCLDAAELMTAKPGELLELCKHHVQLAHRFPQALGYPLDLALILTKLDTLAGFNEFFLSEHQNERLKPLGFSLEASENRKKFLAMLMQQFDNVLENIGEQVIKKLHPVRSTVKRSLIREFPIQLASLRVPIQAVVQALPSTLLRLEAVYFTSAEQSGVSYDGLNSKIHHEYALTVPSAPAQSNHYQACFIDGAIRSFQRATKHYHPKMTQRQKWLAMGIGGCALAVLSFVTYQHIAASNILDDASKELLAYELLANQPSTQENALYHLLKAERSFDFMPKTFLSYPGIDALQSQIHRINQHHIRTAFLPSLVEILQQKLRNVTLPVPERMSALKTYLMLGSSQHFSKKEIIGWFEQDWKKHNHEKPIFNQLLLLKKALKEPFQPITINQELVRDTRNYLNALPSAYLYYTLAKERFPTQMTALHFPGFDLAYHEIPMYFTKAGFQAIFQQLPLISEQLTQDHWVLERQDNQNILDKIQQAYCLEYVYWWNNFIRRTMPKHYQGYEQAQKLTTMLTETKSISNLIHFIQQETSPIPGMKNNLFNQQIATKLTHVNLLSDSGMLGLEDTITELGRFLSTIALINDNGKTVFNLTKSRFANNKSVDPLSMLYAKSQQLPEPASTWAKQIADDTWFIFIHESKHYINEQWTNVYQTYQSTIAHRYPFENDEKKEINIADFDAFFAPKGILNTFVNHYVKPFLNISKPQWQSKSLNGYAMPLSNELLNELIRANVISKMFYPHGHDKSNILFTLQKIELDPVIATLKLSLGKTTLVDNQNTDGDMQFQWPTSNAKLEINGIDGAHYQLVETGVWAFFKLLKKINVLVDENDSTNLQILFEINGNSGRYALKSQNQINPFSPGILTGFVLPEEITT